MEEPKVYRTDWSAWTGSAVYVGLLATWSTPLLFVAIRDSDVVFWVLGIGTAIAFTYGAVASARRKLISDEHGLRRVGLRTRSWPWAQVQDLYLVRDQRFGFVRLYARLGRGGRSLGLAALPTRRSEQRLEQMAALLRSDSRAARRTTTAQRVTSES